MQAAERPRILILGGTGEARALAAALVPRFDVVTSQAGVTSRPRKVAGALRRGGFGGPEALADHLAAERVAALVDATHPFARRMKANARAAAAASGVPLLVLARPAWPHRPGDRWIEVDDASAAAQALASLGRRVFLTTGQRDLDVFARLPGRFFLVRAIEAPIVFPFADGHLLRARGPFRFADELALMRRWRIEVLVTKASGGRATYAKIAAARRLALPVVMIRRGDAPMGTDSVGSVAAAALWLERRLATAGARP
jgi:precorrin-6A/cobalt-precorrin-6A reductase